MQNQLPLCSGRARGIGLEITVAQPAVLAVREHAHLAAGGDCQP